MYVVHKYNNKNYKKYGILLLISILLLYDLGQSDKICLFDIASKSQLIHSNSRSGFCSTQKLIYHCTYLFTERISEVHNFLHFQHLFTLQVYVRETSFSCDMLEKKKKIKKNRKKRIVSSINTNSYTHTLYISKK